MQIMAPQIEDIASVKHCLALADIRIAQYRR